MTSQKFEQFLTPFSPLSRTYALVLEKLFSGSTLGIIGSLFLGKVFSGDLNTGCPKSVNVWISDAF